MSKSALIEIVEIAHKMSRLGWGAANDGNISIKTESGFVVTPSGIAKSELTEDDIVIVQDGGYESVSENRKPSSEFKMHIRCYSERDDVGAVIHAHPPYATAFAIAGRALDDYSLMETVLTLGSVPVTPYATPSTDEVGDSIAPFLQSHDALLLQNHGALTVGCDLATAFARMESLEHWAKILTHTYSMGFTPKEIPRREIERLCSMRVRYVLTGRHPGYRKYNS